MPENAESHASPPHPDTRIIPLDAATIATATPQEVSAAMRAAQSSGGGSSAASGGSPASAHLPADAIPGYEITREIHRGGQGVVYSARQIATHRTVAIKVMREGPFASAPDRARFEREVRILAQLRHPNIVAIHDSGVAANCFFYVMDLIVGEPPDRAAREHQWSVDKTLRTFVKICDAVNAAHMRGVIHRDLKPGNILIDAAGEPHILDFGLAKLAGEEALVTHSPAMTMTGQFVGSLPWASPEQAEGRPDKIDVRTDVYALGVILYQMLTGAFPYDTAGNLTQVLDNIRQREPLRPSGLRAQVNDEVETIVLKCLAKERERRYQSAAELAADLRRYLAGDPVEAKRDSAWYVFRKTVRRYRLPLILAGVFLLAGFGFGVVMTALYSSARHQLELRQREEAQRAREEAEAREAGIARRLYGTRIALAQRKYDEADVAGVRELLDGCPPELRGWEWRRLSWLSDRSVQTLRGHEHFVTAVAISPDGRRIASASFDNTLKLWTSDDGLRFREQPALRGHERPVLAVAFSPDGAHVASAGQDRTIRIWDVAASATVARLEGHWSHVSALAFTPGGDRLVSASHDETVRIWDVAAARELHVFESHGAAVNAVALDAAGTRVASAGDDGDVVVWSLDRREPVARFRAHDGPARALVFHPARPLIATAGADGAVRLWNAESRREERALRAARGEVLSLAWSPDGALLAVGGEDQTVRFWDIATGDPVVAYRGHTGAVDALACSPASGLVVSGARDNTLKLWHANAGDDPLALGGHYGVVHAVAFGPDGRTLASAGQDFSVRLWDATVGEERRTLRGHEWAVRAVAFLADGRIASAGDDGTLHIWNAADDAPPRTLRGHTRGVLSVAASPVGALLASGGQDATVRLWRADDGAPIQTFRGHAGDVLAVAFDAKGRWVASGGADQTVRFWDVPNARELRIASGHQAPVTTVAWSPDSARVASGSADTTIRVWRVADGAELLTLRGHSARVRGVIWDRAGQRMISASDDQTIRIWDAISGDEIVALRAGRNAITSLALSPDGATLVSADDAGALRLWESAEAPSAVRAERVVASAARRLVDALFERETFVDAVQTAIADAPGVSDATRAAARRIAAARGDNPQRLNDQAWRIAKRRGLPLDQYALAVRMAETACRLAPEIGAYLNTLGVARYRAGEHAAALDALQASIQRNGEHPADVAFLAMARFRLGDAAQARRELNRLQELMRQPWCARDDLWQSFLREAETLIAPPTRADERRDE